MNTGLFSKCLLSLLISILLTITPMPESLAWYRPLWLAMICIYWTIALPYQMGLILFWTAGLMQDVLTGLMLGHSAFALLIVAYITTKLAFQIRIAPIVHQCISVMLLLGLYQLIIFWLSGLTGTFPPHWQFWSPILTSALIWPPFLLVLNLFRKKQRRQPNPLGP